MLYLKKVLQLMRIIGLLKDLIFNHWNVAIFPKLGLNSRSYGLLKIVCPEICFDFLIDFDKL